MEVLYHSCELSNNNERHKFCPEGPDSWCSYKREGKLERKDHHLDTRAKVTASLRLNTTACVRAWLRGQTIINWVFNPTVI